MVLIARVDNRGAGTRHMRADRSLDRRLHTTVAARSLQRCSLLKSALVSQLAERVSLSAHRR